MRNRLLLKSLYNLLFHFRGSPERVYHELILRGNKKKLFKEHVFASFLALLSPFGCERSSFGEVERQTKEKPRL